MKESRYRTKRDFADRLALSFADPIELESRSNSKKNPEHEKAKCFLPGTFFFRTMGKPGLTDTNRLITYFSWAAEEGKNKSGWKRNDENATHAVAIAAVVRFLSLSLSLSFASASLQKRKNGKLLLLPHVRTSQATK